MPSSRTGFIDAETILKPIREAEKANQAIAYDKYNADYYNSLIQQLPSVMDLTSRQYPDATYVSRPDVIGLKQSRPTLGGKRKKTTPASYGDGHSFVNDIYSSYYRAVRPGAASDADAKRQARFLAQKAAYETGYGDSIYARHNYGGHEVPDGKGGVRRLAFNSMDDFTKADVKLLDKKWGNWRNAKSDDDFVTAITTDNGYGRYNAVNSDYRNTYKGMTKRVNNYLNNGRRPKAWVGAAIGAASSILGSIFSSNSQERLMREQMEEQRRLREHDNALKTAQSLTQSLNLQQDAQKEYEDRFRINYKCGGRRKLANGAKITDGGPVLNLSTGGLYYAGDKVPYGEYVDLGPTHEERNSSGKTGTGWNINGKKIETENKEVETISPTQMKVYSNSLELPNGMTPAEYVLNGGNENYAFNVQQNMNGDYGIGNKRRLRNGGCLSRPVERIKADDGIIVINGRRMKRVNYKNADGTISNKSYLQDIGPADNGTSWWTNLKDKVNSALNSRIQAPPAKRTTTGTRAVNLNAQNGPFYGSTINSVSNPKTVVNKQSISSSGVHNSNKIVEEPVTQSVVSQDTGRTRQPSRGASVSQDTGRRRLASRGATPKIDLSFTPANVIREPDSVNTGIDMTGLERSMNPYQGLSDREITSRELGFGSATAPTSDITTPAPVDYTSNTNRFGVNFKGADWIQLGADLFSSIYSGINQANMADYIEDTVRPALLAPAKLITNYNIAPRLQTVANSRLSMLRDSDEAVNSAARNARRNQINLATNQAANELWGEKTNKEAELLNTDALNQQGVHEKNINSINDYYNRLADARMRRGLMRAQGRQALFSGIGDAVGNLIDQGKQRYSDQQAMAYYTALLPEEGRRWLKRNGVDFLRRGGKIS